MSNQKSKLGKFYTTRYEYILQNMYIPKDVYSIIEPFAGNGDLLSFIQDKEDYYIECYDIEPMKSYITKRDTLHDPPCYDDKFIITNPPYLARNKNTEKALYEKYNCNDLYKCFLTNIIDSKCLGGILIVPLNFICSIRKKDVELRQQFLTKFHIVRLNIFEEQVFEDTSYTVCSLQFEQKQLIQNKIDNLILCDIYPSKQTISLSFTENNNYTIGGEIYRLPKNNKYTIERATKFTKHVNCITNILLKCIDDSIDNKIQLKMIKDQEKFIDNTPNCSARSYASLVIIPFIDINHQEQLVKKFNEYLETHRTQYHSLFLTNYRESTTIARKRISFELVFQICSYLLE